MAGDSAEATSLKQILQSMMGDGPQVLIGTVIEVNPLKIRIEGDEKLIAGGNSTVIPWHLTDYTTQVIYERGGTESGTEETLTVRNALKNGETVYVLSLNKGKRYFVLDRTGA